MAITTCANDLDPHQRGGWAVAAAVARHHLHASEALMAGWDTEDGTTVSATERLRAAWLVLVRSAPVATEPEPEPARPAEAPRDDRPERAS